uniref:Transcription factor BYE1 n=1 Tax=Mycena chlorophos TaxID=658473 RepID=A0ABQ0KXD9_MYCCL|nr:transcription elongation regulator [Mycena chlorophos]
MSRTTTRTKSQPKQKAKRDTPADVYCLCRGVDDGSPMVNCGHCNEWYHFACVDLSEGTADDINVYICPPCVTKTGHRTVMLWEGPDAVEDASVAPQARVKAEQNDDEPQPSESEKDNESDEEYVGERTKRRRRRISVSSESASEPEKPSRLRKRSSPKPPLKRKATKKANEPPAKRKKRDSSAHDDPARSFCLGKLEGVFSDIFLRYPHVPNSEHGDALMEKQPAELTEAEKAQLEESAKQFAAELEQCVYEEYCEPDRTGKSSAGGKYKDRYRMLQFNLSKVDRTVLHKRIASGGITAKEISVMSSTDLANEQMQQSMKMAEQEALEHSILEKTTAIPRAKLTHKGFEDIEHLDNVSSAERQREEEEKRERERERAARALRTRTLSLSVPPESPVSATWAGPAPRGPMSPVEAQQQQQDGGAVIVSELTTEPEMNLADLINIDDEPGPGVSPVAAAAGSPQQSIPDPILSPSATGISPFAMVKPEPPRASFDLNSLWSAPAPPKKHEDSPPRSPVPGDNKEKDKPEQSMDLDDETDDKDFDMFLEEKESVVPTPEILQAAFEALPRVWTGKINMPLDSTIPQETPVNARQVGGRILESTSVLWKTLFPSDLLRIDGRVPVDKSAQFLLQTRMNSAKELIAVAFTPESSAASTGFQLLMDFLIAKGRHGLVFPWGSRPKEHHPGKELYIIPLLSSDSLPDYMELLDNFHLPKLRSANLLVGIWVLNKGKLVAPPAPPPPVPVPAAIPAAFPPSTGTVAIPPAPISFEPSVLAAEVAQLTPEQVRMMLQTLLPGGVASAAAPAVPVPQQPPSVVPPQQAPQAWGPPPPGYPYQQAPPYPQMGPPPPHQMGPPPHQMPPYGGPPPQHYDHRDYNNNRDQGPGGYDRGRDNTYYGNGHNGHNGHNNNGRNRGRGRGGNGGNGNNGHSPPPPVDSGWPRRQGQGGRW